MARCWLWDLQSWGSGSPSPIPIPTFHLHLSRDLTWYPISSVLTAWELLLAAAPNLSKQPSYLYDLVDVTRQVSVIFEQYYANTGLGKPCAILVLQCRGCIQERGRGGSAHPSHNIYWTTGRLGKGPCNTKRVPSGALAWGCQGEMTELKWPIIDNPGTGHNGCWVKAVRVQCKEPDHALGTRRWPRWIPFLIGYHFSLDTISFWIPFPFGYHFSFFPGQILDYAGKQWAGMVSKYYIPRYCICTLRKVKSNLLHQMENVLQDFRTVSSHWKEVWLRGVQGGFETVDCPEVNPDNLLYSSEGLCEEAGNSFHHFKDSLSHWSRGRHPSGENLSFAIPL